MDAVERILIGRSAELSRIRDLIRRIGPTSLAVLIQGETGTGKELVARALHAASGVRGNLVPVNVCALNESLVESALFGHVRGAFTGAIAERPGYLREAHGGTLFLDEINGMPVGTQPKLLRALETQQFRPVGGRSDVGSRFRVLSATNVGASELVTQNIVRSDLLQRLSAVVISLPSLRERSEDVPALAHHFLDRKACESGLPLTLAAGALELLRTTSWPGNIRQLRQVIDAAAALATSDQVDESTIEEALALSLGRQSQRRDSTREQLIAVLEKEAWRIGSVARRYRVHRVTIYRWMKEHGIASPHAKHARTARARATGRGVSCNATLHPLVAMQRSV